MNAQNVEKKSTRKKSSPINKEKFVFENSGSMDKDFMTTFLWNKMNNRQKRVATKLFEEEPEAYIEYKVISFNGATDGDSGLFYSEIWLLDLGSNYFISRYSAVVVNRINNSSAYAMTRCGMDYDNDDDDDDIRKWKYTELSKMFRNDVINGAQFWKSVRHHFV
jgi:hypothetical protein